MRHVSVFSEVGSCHLLHLLYTDKDKDLCDIIRVDHWVDHLGDLTSVQPIEILGIASIACCLWCIRGEPSPLGCANLFTGLPINLASESFDRSHSDHTLANTLFLKRNSGSLRVKCPANSVTRFLASQRLLSQELNYFLRK